MTPLAPHVQAFFSLRLPSERGASAHTSASYSDSFRLLLDFASKRLRRSPSTLRLEDIDAPLVLAFLNGLEKERGNSAATRNVRLAAIKSFMRFLEHRVPSAIEQIRRVLAIPFKKTDNRLVPFLSQAEWSALINAPDAGTWLGVRDRALLHLAVSSGLRVSELIDIRLEDLELQPRPSLAIRGKGRRHRSLPLWNDVAKSLRRWLAIRGAQRAPEIFVTRRGEPLTRRAVEEIVERYAAKAAGGCKSLREKRVSPHVLRHTCAMIVLQATGDLRRVALWLGHENMQTTEIYTRADPTEKLQALETKLPEQLRPGRFRPPDHLMAFLKEQSLCADQPTPRSVPKEKARSHRALR